MAHKVRLFNRHFHLPQSKPVRIGLGILLVAGGLVGFLPVLGFWMVPLGLLVFGSYVVLLLRFGVLAASVRLMVAPSRMSTS